jgi:hypothetical protein
MRLFALPTLLIAMLLTTHLYAQETYVMGWEPRKPPVPPV